MRRLLMVLTFIAATAASAQQRHGDTADDVLQHVPLATVFVLRACETGGSSWTQLSLTALSSYALSAATTYTLKHTLSERRPDKSDRRSFPSGHATMAFAGATVLSHEYGHLSPWVAIGGYGVATLTALDRVRRDRHYLHDVCAGAAIGICATELTYLLRRRLFRSRSVDLSFSGQTLDLTLRW